MTTYQAELATRSPSATVETDPATGAKYVNPGGPNSSGAGESITWSIAETGDVTLSLRFLNPGSADRPVMVEVNGIAAAVIPCPPVKVWTNSAAAAVKIPAGAKVRTVFGAAGGPNLDSMTVESVPAVMPNVPLPATPVGVNAFGDYIAALKAQGWFADRKSALVGNRSLFGLNTGHIGDPNTFATVKAKDLKSNQDYHNVKIVGSDYNGAEPHVTNFISDHNGFYGISDAGKNAIFKNGTISNVGSACIYSSGNFIGIEGFNSGGDILKPRDNSNFEWIWGYNGGYNSPTAHADFAQVIGAGNISLKKCFADMMRTANTKSNSFSQFQSGAHDIACEDIVVDGFTAAFHQDAIRSSLNRIYFFESASSTLITSNNSDDKLGELYSAITGKTLAWNWKAPK